MKVQNIRFGHRDWELIQEAAEESGVSAAQFVRNWAKTGALIETREQVSSARRLAREFHRLDDHD